MKKIIVFLIVSMMSLVIFGCSKDENQVQPAPEVKQEDVVEDTIKEDIDDSTNVDSEPTVLPDKNDKEVDEKNEVEVEDKEEEENVPDNIPDNELEKENKYISLEDDLELSNSTTYLNDLINKQNYLQNEGDYVMEGGWLYGLDWDDNGNGIFMKVRLDGEDYTILENRYVQNVQIIGNYIYYTINHEKKGENGIYRMRTSGTGKEQIKKVEGCAMQVVGDYIYYTPDTWLTENEITDKNTHLYRCDLDGKNVTEIIDRPTFCWFVFKNKILYQDDRDNSALYTCDLDGNNRFKINKDRSYGPIYDGAYIYYVKETKEGKDYKREIWRIREDGTEDTLVSNYMMSYRFCLKEDYIYFDLAEDENRLYRIKKDGTDLTLISQDKNVSCMYFIEDKLCYLVRSDKGYIDKILLCEEDGSNAVDLAEMF